MARTIRWTQTAVDDIEEAVNFIAKDSQFYARALARETREAAISLKFFAERGSKVIESILPNIHEIYIKNYRLIYKITEDHVFILAFVHSARDLPKLLKHRKM